MCLGIPAQVVAIVDADAGLALAETAGVRRQINLALLAADDRALSALVGEWVLLHVGFAMARIDQQEAERTLALLAQMEASHEP
ncbi:HypC/HybG/HupF family hydrogenase formation chaperone [Oceanimonas sp. CHS3-5]|uniref:HypC/HybG/HupF family hydrogenase formation chaperone n=1 Tax=Oceanimonas sp. CHS3-5 TaxID=3068186 RepID=UPI00273E4496|nr:HypC/HybG/HupF family hydrogenase formation chaperone [Oceanimonas sp. CHS3-5]MDP5291392.1 HypC/HybG/HupF family hydrogenase formation chaperone [Oceanimonas sp. CHS3-5]